MRKYKSEQHEVSAKEFKDLADVSEGMVFIGCGGDLNDWINGIGERLVEDGIVTGKGSVEFKDLWKDVFSLKTTGGRIDLVLFTLDGKLNVGKLALWRLKFGECSWVSDYKVNYADHHATSIPNVGEDGVKRVTMSLIGINGNAFSILAAFKTQAKKEDWEPDEIESVLTEASDGDYNHLIQTVMKYSEMPEEDEEGEDWD